MEREAKRARRASTDSGGDQLSALPRDLWVLILGLVVDLGNLADLVRMRCVSRQFRVYVDLTWDCIGVGRSLGSLLHSWLESPWRKCLRGGRRRATWVYVHTQVSIEMKQVMGKDGKGTAILPACEAGRGCGALARLLLAQGIPCFQLPMDKYYHPGPIPLIHPHAHTYPWMMAMRGHLALLEQTYGGRKYDGLLVPLPQPSPDLHLTTGDMPKVVRHMPLTLPPPPAYHAGMIGPVSRGRPHWLPII